MFAKFYFYLICLIYFIFQNAFDSRMKKAASQVDDLTLDGSQQVDRDFMLSAWAEIVGGKNRGRLYGVGDMASHFSRRGGSNFYSSQTCKAASGGSSSQNTAECLRLQEKIDQLQRVHEEE